MQAILTVLVLAFLGLNFWLERKRNQQLNDLQGVVQELADIINHNAAIGKSTKVDVMAIGEYLQQQDDQFSAFGQYLKNYIVQYQKNPDQYPYKPEEWVEEFYLLHPKNEVDA